MKALLLRAGTGVAVGVLTAFALMLGCNTAKLTPRSDTDASCDPVVEYPCKAEPLGSAACTPNAASSDPLEARLAPDASYASGCTILVPSPAPDDFGQCTVLGSCRCTSPEAGAPSWICTPP